MLTCHLRVVEMTLNANDPEFWNRFTANVREANPEKTRADDEARIERAEARAAAAEARAAEADARAAAAAEAEARAEAAAEAADASPPFDSPSDYWDPQRGFQSSEVRASFEEAYDRGHGYGPRGFVADGIQRSRPLGSQGVDACDGNANDRNCQAAYRNYEISRARGTQFHRAMEDTEGNRDGSLAWAKNPAIFHPDNYRAPEPSRACPSGFAAEYFDGENNGGDKCRQSYIAYRKARQEYVRRNCNRNRRDGENAVQCRSRLYLEFDQWAREHGAAWFPGLTAGDYDAAQAHQFAAPASAPAPEAADEDTEDTEDGVAEYVDRFQMWNEENLGALRWVNPLYTVIAAGEAVAELFDDAAGVTAPLPSPSSASSEWPAGYGEYDGPAMAGDEWPANYGTYRAAEASAAAEVDSILGD
jgi:hypothetical protein